MNINISGDVKKQLTRKTEGVGGGGPTACDNVLLRFRYARKALKHGYIALNWVTHVDVVLKACSCFHGL